MVLAHSNTFSVLVNGPGAMATIRVLSLLLNKGHFQCPQCIPYSEVSLHAGVSLEGDRTD